MGDSCNGEEETEPSQVISVDVEQGDKETESNENEIDNSNKWEHESPNGPPSLQVIIPIPVMILFPLISRRL